eukprot:scpid32129/ scgid16342/ Sentrin-specific protease 1; SUMO-1 protease 2; Sentrin/SUMO-specific protease SENP1
MQSRKRRWDDSDSDEEAVEPDSSNQPSSKRRFTGLAQTLFVPFRWVAKQLSSLFTGNEQDSSDPRSSAIVGTAVAPLLLPPSVVLSGEETTGSAGGAGTGARTASTGTHHSSASQGLFSGVRRHHRYPQLHAANSAAATAAAVHAMSSPNGPAVPPFHFSPSPVGRGRGTALSSHLTNAAAANRLPSFSGTSTATAAMSSAQAMAPAAASQPTEQHASAELVNSTDGNPAPGPHQAPSSSQASSKSLKASSASSATASTARTSAPLQVSASQPANSSVDTGFDMPIIRPVQATARSHGATSEKSRQRRPLFANDTAHLKEADRYRRVLQQFSTPHSRHKSQDAVRLEERDQYRSLLQQITSPPPTRRGSSSGGDHVEKEDGADHDDHVPYPSSIVNHASSSPGQVDDSEVLITSEVPGNPNLASPTHVVSFPRHATSQPHQSAAETMSALPAAHIVSSPYGFEVADTAREPHATSPQASYVFLPQSSTAQPPSHVYPTEDRRRIQQQSASASHVFRSPMVSHVTAPPRHIRPAPTFQSRPVASAAPTTAAASSRMPSTRSAGFRRSSHDEPGDYNARHRDTACLLSDDDGEEEHEEPAVARGSDDISTERTGYHPAPAASRSWAKISSHSGVKQAMSTDWITSLVSDVDNVLKERQQRADTLERSLQKMRLQREEKELAETQQLKERLETVRQRSKDMRLIDAPLLDEDEEEEEELPELTEEQEEMVSKALRRSGSQSQVLSTAFNIDMARSDIATLSGSGWLNDEVINFFFQMIKARNDADEDLPSVHVMSSFFYPKLLSTGYASIKRWTRKVDIFSKDLIAIPIHLGMHWCLAMIDFRAQAVTYYDSLLGDNSQCLSSLRKYIQDESKDKKKTEFDLSDWTFDQATDIPEQMNGCDCGVFTCTYAAYLTRDKSFSFSQDDMPYFRRRMVYEILSKKLMV